MWPTRGCGTVGSASRGNPGISGHRVLPLRYQHDPLRRAAEAPESSTSTSSATIPTAASMANREHCEQDVGYHRLQIVRLHPSTAISSKSSTFDKLIYAFGRLRSRRNLTELDKELRARQQLSASESPLLQAPTEMTDLTLISANSPWPTGSISLTGGHRQRQPFADTGVPAKVREGAECNSDPLHITSSAIAPKKMAETSPTGSPSLTGGDCQSVHSHSHSRPSGSTASSRRSRTASWTSSSSSGNILLKELPKADRIDLPESDQAKAGLGGDETDLLAGVRAPCEGLSPRAQAQVSTADRLLESRGGIVSVDVTTSVDCHVEGGVLCGDAHTCLPTSSARSPSEPSDACGSMPCLHVIFATNGAGGS